MREAVITVRMPTLAALKAMPKANHLQGFLAQSDFTREKFVATFTKIAKRSQDPSPLSHIVSVADEVWRLPVQVRKISPTCRAALSVMG